MNKIAVIYWSGTGNTKAMAKAIFEAIKVTNASAEIFNVDDIAAETAQTYDALVLGCPAMGGEVLEEMDFEPFFTSLETRLTGKKVALFGSYDWGDGEWMRDWQARVSDAGAMLFEEGLIINNAPDQSGLAECDAFGKRFAPF